MWGTTSTLNRLRDPVTPRTRLPRLRRDIRPEDATMATRKKASKKRASKRARAFGIELELPTTLREFAKELRKRLDRLERDAARAQLEARRRAAKLLREASQQLGRLEVGGEAAWRK